MTVDLSDYVVNLQRELNPPGSNLFPNAVDEDWEGQLVDGFWEARLDGLLPLDVYSCDEDGLVTPIVATTPDLPRDLIQLVIMWAGIRVLRTYLRELRTAFSTTAGPVKFEYQQSATVVAAILKDMVDRRNLVLSRLSDVGTTNDIMIDAIIARDQNLRDNLTWWVASDTGDFVNR